MGANYSLLPRPAEQSAEWDVNRMLERAINNSREKFRLIRNAKGQAWKSHAFVIVLITGERSGIPVALRGE